MRRLFSAKLAGTILLLSLGLLFLFHILVLLRVVPASRVWGGMVENASSNLMALEMVALLVTLLFLFIVAAKMGYVRAGRLRGAVNAGAWLIFAFLLLNTLGNLASAVSFENLVAAPLTILLALCAWRLAIEK